MATGARANGTVEKANSEKRTEVPEKPKASSVSVTPPEPPKASSPRRRQQFFFADAAWRAKSAVDHVSEFIDSVRKFISDAEAKFQPTPAA
jgi:hypothetical protein